MNWNQKKAYITELSEQFELACKIEDVTDPNVKAVITVHALSPGTICTAEELNTAIYKFTQQLNQKLNEPFVYDEKVSPDFANQIVVHDDWSESKPNMQENFSIRFESEEHQKLLEEDPRYRTQEAILHKADCFLSEEELLNEDNTLF